MICFFSLRCYRDEPAMTSMSLNYNTIVNDFLRLFKGPETEAKKRSRYAEKASAKTQEMMKEYTEWDNLVKDLTEKLETEEANLAKLSLAYKQLNADKELMLKGKNPDRRTLKWLRNLLTSKTKKYVKKVKEQRKFADELKTTNNALRKLEKEIKHATANKKTLILTLDREIAYFQEFYDDKVDPAFKNHQKSVEWYTAAYDSLLSPGPRTAKERMEKAQLVVPT